MMKGTSASAGIGIGKAAIVEETELVIKKETISDAAAEKERFHAALNLSLIHIWYPGVSMIFE